MNLYELLKSKGVEGAQLLFSYIQELDGQGLHITDNMLLAETVAAEFKLKPEEVDESYGQLPEFMQYVA